MHDYDAIAADYIDAFNATDSARRAKLVAALFTEDVSYVDPMAEVAGHDGVGGFIAAAHAQFPGWTFALAGSVDGHHDQARFTWTLGPAGDEPPVQGFDVVSLDAAGKIKAVHGFLDKVPAALAG
ncbi:MAG: nuclear transport factor 2 family protein [Stackebrandtia sp.]